MSFEDKNFPPSKRKLKKERKKGNIWVSTEFASSIFLGLSFLFLIFLFSFFSFEKIFYSLFTNLNELTVETAFQKAFQPILTQVLIFFCFVFVCAFFGYVIQRGWIWKWRRSKGNFFKRRKKRWLFPLLKIIASIVVAYAVLKNIPSNTPIIFSSAQEKLYFLFKKAFILCAFIILVYFLLGILDLFYQRWDYFKKMRMSKKEIQDERREEETSQNIKQKR